MDAETKKLLQEQYAKLPKQLQDAIQSSHVNELVGTIAAQNKLHIDQIEVFKNEVMMLMMGFTDPIEFVGELQKSLGVTADVALKIATDTNEQILLPIREKVENATSDTANTTQAPVNAPAVHTPPTSEKSVVMPSAVKASAPVAIPIVVPPPPVVAPSAPTSSTAPATASPTPAVVKPAGLPAMPHVDVMLSEPTVSIAPKPTTSAPTSAAPAAPANATIPAPVDVKKSDAPAPPPIYKTDPYHEPID